MSCGARSDVLDAPAPGSSVGSGDLPNGSVYPWEAGAGGRSLREPRDCVQDWGTLYESGGVIPSALVVTEGEVIFGVASLDGEPPQIRALDITSKVGRYRVVRDGRAYRDLWLDGDDLFLWWEEQVFRLPLTGGYEERLLDARAADASGRIRSVSFEQGTIYWTQSGNDPSELAVWRKAIDQPGLQRIASVRTSVFPAPRLVATRERLILTEGSNAISIALPGGDTTSLDSVDDGELAGVDDLGVYFLRAANRTRRGGRALELEIRRAPADGSPTTRFWRGAAGHLLSDVWSLDSGWLATGAYYMFDGTPHAVIVHIDALGEAQLIACDRGDGAFLGRPVFWRDALYAVTVTPNERWRIVEIRLD